MNHDDLIEQLVGARRPARQSKDCIDVYRLAAIASGDAFSAKERKHVADCVHCIERLADLNRIDRSPTPHPLASDLLDLARHPGTRGITWRQAPRWAAAAVLVLVVGLTAGSVAERQDLIGQPVLTAGDPVREVRNIDSHALRPEILTPTEGQGLSAAGPQFEWTALPGSLYYDIRLVSPDGEPVWTARVDGTSVNLPDSVHLQPGADYYVRVDAYLAEAKRVSSRHVLFSTEARP